MKLKHSIMMVGVATISMIFTAIAGGLFMVYIDEGLGSVLVMQSPIMFLAGLVITYTNIKSEERGEA